MMDLLDLQSIQRDRDREHARLDLISRARAAAPPSPARFARLASRLLAAVPRRDPCPDPPCPDLDPRARAAFDR